MRYFLIIDFEAKISFDGFRGKDFEDALRNSLREDPEQVGWNPEGLSDYKIEAEWDEKNGWVFKNGHFDKYVALIFNSFITRPEVTILDITDPLDVISIKHN